MRIRFNKNVDVTYISYVFMTDYIKKKLDQIKSGTTNVYAIYFKDLKNIEIPLPNLSLQKEFNIKIESMYAVKNCHLKTIKYAEKLITSLQQQSFGIN
jgi:type I restriction enzyme, S subunit